MGIDTSATKSKEIYIQAELYRILRNVCVVPFLQIPQANPWKPKDVLIEAKMSERRMRLDLVLIGERKTSYGVEDKPILVIEVKKRKHERLTRPYQSYLQQADTYARSVGCKCYSVHDGNTFILMQMADPFLIGFSQESIWRNENEKQDFANRVWKSMLRIAGTTVNDPVEEFQRHSDIFPWKGTIPHLIKDAYVRNARAANWEPDADQAMRKGQSLAEKWLGMYEEGLV